MKFNELQVGDVLIADPELTYVLVTVHATIHENIWVDLSDGSIITGIRDGDTVRDPVLRGDLLNDPL